VRTFPWPSRCWNRLSPRAYEISSRVFSRPTWGIRLRLAARRLDQAGPSRWEGLIRGEGELALVSFPQAVRTTTSCSLAVNCKERPGALPINITEHIHVQLRLHLCRLIIPLHAACMIRACIPNIRKADGIQHRTSDSFVCVRASAATITAKRCTDMSKRWICCLYSLYASPSSCVLGHRVLHCTLRNQIMFYDTTSYHVHIRRNIYTQPCSSYGIISNHV